MENCVIFKVIYRRLTLDSLHLVLKYQRLSFLRKNHYRRWLGVILEYPFSLKFTLPATPATDTSGHATRHVKRDSIHFVKNVDPRRLPSGTSYLSLRSIRPS